VARTVANLKLSFTERRRGLKELLLTAASDVKQLIGDQIYWHLSQALSAWSESDSCENRISRACII